jgi:hypothetical protein
MRIKNNKQLMILSFTLMTMYTLVMISSCKKDDDKDTTTQKSQERLDYISMKQDGVPVVIDSISTSSREIIPGVFKSVKITFYDKSKNMYEFNLADSSLDLSYLTPKRFQGSGSSFIHFNNGKYFSGSNQFSSFTCTKSDKNTKRFSGYFEIMYLNEPNRNDTILVTEGVVENLKLP